MPKDPLVAFGSGFIDTCCLAVLGHCPSPPSSISGVRQLRSASCLLHGSLPLRGSTCPPGVTGWALSLRHGLSGPMMSPHANCLPHPSGVSALSLGMEHGCGERRGPENNNLGFSTTPPFPPLPLFRPPSQVLDDGAVPGKLRRRRAVAVEAIGTLYRSIAKTQAEVEGHKNGVPPDGPAAAAGAGDDSPFGATFGSQQKYDSQPPQKEHPKFNPSGPPVPEAEPGELPFGWAWARDAKGKVYFIGRLLPFRGDRSPSLPPILLLSSFPYLLISFLVRV